ncbi:aldo/keto reductase [Bacillaceae bacterium SIJ1]|uniref:aldo/keto reductase n=1 Tax=Litoribacterium kuwaitense TaxID=1398745 RepID=UPI0013EC867F|nr:aldo/keto reductase [Litoribacterium kuwaitense]NGP44899.1 aldo/keto reductase [Litoribacterium kuwaitense]
MQYTELGKTGITVSKLGLGGAPIGGDFSDITDPKAIEVIHAALDLGVNFFDTAPLYGRGESERRFGIALKGRRENIVLATKAVMRGDSYSYDNTIQCVEESLQRLQTDYIDLIQLHEAECTTYEEAMEGTMAAFLKLKEQGKVRAIGVNAGQTELLIPYIKSGKIDTIQTFSKYMLIDHTAKDELIPLAKKMNVGVINGSPLGMGVLADAPAPFLLKNTALLAEAEKRKEQISFLRKTEPKGLIEPAMRFSLSHPNIAVTLTGTTSLNSLKKNARYCDGRGLTEDEQRRVYELFDQRPLH